MQKLGYDCLEVVFDEPLLQEKWCQENNYPFSWNQASILQILKHQIKTHKPDILYLERCAFHNLPLSFQDQCRSLFPSIRIFTGYWGAQIQNPKTFQYFRNVDFLFCLDAHLQRQFSQKNIPSFIIPHAWDFTGQFPSEKEIDFGFVGMSGFGFLDHELRFQDLKYLLSQTKLKVWCEEASLPSWKLFLKKNLSLLLSLFPSSISSLIEKKGSFLPRKLRNLWDKEKLQAWYHWEKPLFKLFPHRVFPPLYGVDYLEHLAKTQLVFNRHVDQKEHGGNMRCFEATGVGSCLLTDRLDQMKDLFTEEEVVSYKTIEEAKEKADYLLSHPKTLQAIAQKGQARTLKQHTTWHRCQQMDLHIRQFLSG